MSAVEEVRLRNVYCIEYAHISYCAIIFCCTNVQEAAKAALDVQFYGRCITAFNALVERAVASPRDARRFLQDATAKLSLQVPTDMFATASMEAAEAAFAAQVRCAAVGSLSTQHCQA